MTNLDRLADSDLLMQGFFDLVRGFMRSRTEHLMGDQPAGPETPDRGDQGNAPESLHRFYQLWDEYPESCLGESVGMVPWERAEGGHLLFARMLTNWEFGVIQNPEAAASCPNDGWELRAFSENDGKWRSLPGVRLDHFLVEAGLLSLFLLPFSVRVVGKDEAAAECWDGVLAPAQTVWTGKFRQELGMYQFDYTHRIFQWDPRGILLRTEAQEYGIDFGNEPRPTLPFRYATFTHRDAWEAFIRLPGCRRNDTGHVSQPVE